MTNRRRNWRLRNILATPTTVALCGVFAIGALGIPSSPHHTSFVWNASASAPIGLYRVVHHRALARGDLVLVVPGPALARFADARGYLSLGVPLVKRIAALARDSVCARGYVIFINGRLVTIRLLTDGKGRLLPSWHGCSTLKANEVFLLMAGSRTSFDGRYFGLTKISQIVGTLDPIWTR